MRRWPVFFCACALLAAPVACLESTDDIEIVDAELGNPTPTPTPPAKGDPSAAKTYSEAFLLWVEKDLGLVDDAKIASFEKAAASGLSAKQLTNDKGTAALVNLQTLAENSGKWLVKNGFVASAGQLDIAFGAILQGCYGAASLLARQAKDGNIDILLPKATQAAAKSYDDLTTTVIPDAYAEDVLDSAADLFQTLREAEKVTEGTGVAEDDLRSQSTIVLAELFMGLPNVENFSTTYATSAQQYVTDFAREAGAVVIPAIIQGTKQSASAFKDAYGAALGTKLDGATILVTTSVVATKASIITAIGEGLAASK